MKNRSLTLRLISVLSLTALLVWFGSTLVAWWQVRHDVNKVFDAQQVLFAERLANSDLSAILLESSTKLDKNSQSALKKSYDDDALAFAIFSQTGKLLFSDGRNGKRFIFNNKMGFHNANIYDDDDKWRIFWRTAANGELFIAVGQELDYREDLIEEMIFGQMWIWFASLPILIIILGWLIHKELRPIKRLSQEVQSRKSGDVSLLNPSGLPVEMLPLVKNLNQFFDRTSAMLQRERRFTSDAAHELRSPLAALRIQTEVAQLANDDASLREQALTHLTQGIDRASQLIEQLLTLSRLDNLQALETLQPLDWEAIVQSLISERYFVAEKRKITLVFEKESEPKQKQGQSILVSLMLRNLLDNAIKYCPEETTVSVKIASSQIIIEDNGGGVEPEDLKKLGQRFYRPAGQNEKGSGLGLSIVMRIAELHGFKVRLENVIKESQRIGLKAIIYL
ncbi:two-component system sensor histidine kinase QseC [Haemophilus influenzae]|uniref:quorum sensing histidine kinase QseC n=1 Tax=Haemophilus influenzae TaxID=727 RepID=UPI000DD48B1F|nr:quorum sensing histidine kinase QseC [Haemophilus influenzae]MCK8794886.1 two-component system sensor histidine kinase QseC [Haemophilus influenzae]MCK8829512.1 two-component system sensor histidine kinase QseC [Haemophilus influenzae]MCK8839968.1 two-component system sensor histidine kinase QseC [Haemophilus influenzae]MCK9061842.1 two-component system sensor histidine kinase QseC [Haemophilus influenzae]MCK9079553.1 two-component system sensor histidine kinase QseC [Haemophilus influenzae